MAGVADCGEASREHGFTAELCQALRSTIHASSAWLSQAASRAHLDHAGPKQRDSSDEVAAADDEALGEVRRELSAAWRSAVATHEALQRELRQQAEVIRALSTMLGKPFPDSSSSPGGSCGSNKAPDTPRSTDGLPSTAHTSPGAHSSSGGSLSPPPSLSPARGASDSSGGGVPAAVAARTGDGDEACGEGGRRAPATGRPPGAPAALRLPPGWRSAGDRRSGEEPTPTAAEDGNDGASGSGDGEARETSDGMREMVSEDGKRPPEVEVERCSPVGQEAEEEEEDEEAHAVAVTELPAEDVLLEEEKDCAADVVLGVMLDEQKDGTADVFLALRDMEAPTATATAAGGSGARSTRPRGRPAKRRSRAAEQTGAASGGAAASRGSAKGRQQHPPQQRAKRGEEPGTEA